MKKNLSIKVAGNNIKHFKISRSYALTDQYCNSLSTDVRQMPNNCQQLWSSSCHNSLPWQRYSRLKTPLILTFSAYNSKTARSKHFFITEV